jgi:hypothetical protein
MRLAHLISVRLVADIRLTGRLCCIVRYDGRRVRLETFHWRRRCRQISPLFERLHYSRRIKPWISVDEVDHLFKLGGAKLGRDFINAALVEQQDSRDHILGHAFGGGPAHFLWMKIETEAIRHGAGRYTGCANRRHRPAAGAGPPRDILLARRAPPGAHPASHKPGDRVQVARHVSCARLGSPPSVYFSCFVRRYSPGLIAAPEEVHALCCRKTKT